MGKESGASGATEPGPPQVRLLYLPGDDLSTLTVDNTAVIDVAHDVGVSARTKHFDRAIHYLRDLVQLRRVIPIFVRTHIQRADGLTKALDKAKYLDWLKMFFT